MHAIMNSIARIKFPVFALIALIVFALVLLLSGCSMGAKAADPHASSAAVDEEIVVTPPPVNNNLKQFGEVVTYNDGVSISVALIGPFTPSNVSYMPTAEGETPLVFKVVLTNNSDEILDPGASPQMTSAGRQATYIADVGNPEYGDLGLFPTTAVLPGQTLEWYTAFSVVDPSDLTMQIQPAPFKYDKAIFTNIAF